MVRAFTQLIQDEQAAVMIETVLWIPIILALLIAAIDVTAVYVTHTEMGNSARGMVGSRAGG